MSDSKPLKVNLQKSVKGTIIKTLEDLQNKSPDNQAEGKEQQRQALRRLLITTLAQEIRGNKYQPVKLEVTASSIQGPTLLARTPEEQRPQYRPTILQAVANKIILAHRDAILQPPLHKRNRESPAKPNEDEAPLDSLVREIHPRNYALINPKRFRKEITGTQQLANDDQSFAQMLEDRYDQKKLSNHLQVLLEALSQFNKNDKDAQERLIIALMPLIVFQLELKESTIIDYYSGKHLILGEDEKIIFEKENGDLQQATLKINIRIPLETSKDPSRKPTVNENYLNAISRLLNILIGQPPEVTKEIVESILKNISPRADTLFLSLFTIPNKYQ